MGGEHHIAGAPVITLQLENQEATASYKLGPDSIQYGYNGQLTSVPAEEDYLVDQISSALRQERFTPDPTRLREIITRAIQTQDRDFNPARGH